MGFGMTKTGYSLIIEVKTSDAYRINLDRIAGYRENLIKAGKVSGNCSVLLVVGRDDTGDLEAQVRGSRHAWSVRIISIEAFVDRGVQAWLRITLTERDGKVYHLPPFG
jgi:hypothetical protein